MTESLIGTGALFHKAVNPAVVVEPVETPFHLPTLARIAGMPEFRRKQSSMIVPSSRNAGMDISDKQGVAERIAVVSFVRADPPRNVDRNAINRAKRQ